MTHIDRRQFVQAILPLGATLMSWKHLKGENGRKRIGIIGLDTSHAVAFTKALFEAQPSSEYLGYQVVAAYPYGNTTIALNRDRIPRNIVEIQRYQVSIMDSIEALLDTVDCVLLETNDGNMHLAQAEQVLRAHKPLFIDKPIANSYRDTHRIFELARQQATPCFSSSSLRYLAGIPELDRSTVTGAEVYTAAPTEPSHKDLYWYGIHGVEMLFAIMGTGCLEVTTHSGYSSDLIVGRWRDGRYGSVRAIREGAQDFGGQVFTKKEIVKLGKFEGYAPLLKRIVQFFDSRVVPFDNRETLEISAFIDAAATSKMKKGKTISLF
jgi:predicted dehydrogenase